MPRPPRPPDVAVLCCIPLGHWDWVESAAQRPAGDFVRFVSEGLLRRPATEAWSIFSNELRFMSRKLDEIERRGIEVVRNAARADIARASARHRDLVVIAHWKSAPLPSDGGLPCDRLETRDAMLTADEFTDLFDEGFRGTVQMIVCNSDIPAETFRRKHRDVICICSDEPALAGLSIAKLDAALRLMEVDARPLWKALLRAGELIDSVVDEQRRAAGVASN